jgi:glycosyltransferase involved in cell wall biosynthesis
MGKIALVHDFLFTYGGAERVLSALHEIYPEAPIYTTFADPQVVNEHFPDADLRTSYLQGSWFRSHPSWLLTAYPRAIESFSFDEYDTVISSSGAFSHGIITGPHTLHICYCHTPMRYAWDYHSRYLDEKGIRNTFLRYFAERTLSKLRTWDAVSAKRVDHWIANSTVVQERIQRFYQAKSTVIYPPVSIPKRLSSKPRTTELKKAITVSRLTPNKRIDIMIRACADKNIELVIVGEGADRQRLESIAQETQAKVTFTGSVGEKEKFALIADSDLFLFAAEDDFGIAPVEAMGCGVPVAALKKGGATETVKEGHSGYFFTDATQASLSSLLDTLKTEGMHIPPEQCIQQAQTFSPEMFSQKIREFVALCQTK